MSLELLIPPPYKAKGSTFYTLFAIDEENPVPAQGEYFDIEKDGELWQPNQEFVYAAWGNITSPDKNDNNPFTFGHKATFRIRRISTDEWSNAASL